MPLYYIHFDADPAEPYPPVAELPSIEADSPLAAAQAMLTQGRVP